MVVVNDKANGNPHVGAGSHARPREGGVSEHRGRACPARALRPHNVVKANTALNDTLTDGRRMHRPYRNCHPAIRDCPYAWWWFVL